MWPVNVSFFPIHLSSDLARNCLNGFNLLPFFFPPQFFFPEALQKHSFWYSKFGVLIMEVIHLPNSLYGSFVSYLNSLENAHLPQVTGPPLAKFPSKGKRVSSAGLALCLQNSCFPGESFNLLHKIRQLKQLLCVFVSPSAWVFLLPPTYKLTGSFLSHMTEVSKISKSFELLETKAEWIGKKQTNPN